MQTYISILRGINVSGHRIIKMADLRAMYAELGFADCQTYIQSGNVIFRWEETKLEELASKIEKKIEEKFGFSVPVIVRELAELKAIVVDNPFIGNPLKDEAHLHITFLSSTPAEDDLNKIQKELYLPVEFQLVGSSVYLFCPNGYSQSKLTNSFLESRLKVTATTRNWKTTKELLLIAEKTSALTK